MKVYSSIGRALHWRCRGNWFKSNYTYLHLIFLYIKICIIANVIKHNKYTIDNDSKRSFLSKKIILFIRLLFFLSFLLKVWIFKTEYIYSFRIIVAQWVQICYLKALSRALFVHDIILIIAGLNIQFLSDFVYSVLIDLISLGDSTEQ